jgi:phosphonate transport system permease protein
VKAFILGAIVLLLFSFWYVQADFSKLWAPRTAQLLAGVIHDAFPPDGSQLSQLFTLSLKLLPCLSWQWLVLGFGGILLSFPAAHNFLLPGGILNNGSRSPQPLLKKGGGNLQIAGGEPVLCIYPVCTAVCSCCPRTDLGVNLFCLLFPGILPGAIALGLHNLGILGRLMAEVTENLDERPMRSLKA